MSLTIEHINCRLVAPAIHSLLAAPNVIEVSEAENLFGYFFNAVGALGNKAKAKRQRFITITDDSHYHVVTLYYDPDKHEHFVMLESGDESDVTSSSFYVPVPYANNKHRLLVHPV